MAYINDKDSENSRPESSATMASFNYPSMQARFSLAEFKRAAFEDPRHFAFPRIREEQGELPWKPFATPRNFKASSKGEEGESSKSQLIARAVSLSIGR